MLRKAASSAKAPAIIACVVNVETRALTVETKLRLLGDDDVSAVNRTRQISPLNGNITEIHRDTRTH
jgi:hypothetical protein